MFNLFWARVLEETSVLSKLRYDGFNDLTHEGVFKVGEKNSHF